MKTNLSHSDIVAAKAVSDPLRDGLVYLGHHAGSRDAFPGVWSSKRNAKKPEPAEWCGGGVGDLLAVAMAADCTFLDQLMGKIVALYQDKRYTHLGVVRSSRPVPAAVGTANGPFDRIVWIEVIALAPHGAVVDAGGASPAWTTGIGHFIQIDNVDAWKDNEAAANAFRKRLWEAFGIDCPEDVQPPSFAHRFAPSGPRHDFTIQYPVRGEYFIQNFRRTPAPKTQDWLSDTNEALLYLHVPFCEAKCFYCNFAGGVSADEQVHVGYVDALLRELDSHADWLGRTPIGASLANRDGNSCARSRVLAA